MQNFHIASLDRGLAPAIQARLNSRTKPLGSLGRLEAVALQAALVQQAQRPVLRAPRIAVFAGDHGAARVGVSAYPQAVTAQMVANFLAGGSAINVLAREAGLELSIVDAGVASDIDPALNRSGVEFVVAKTARGTANYLERAAMTAPQCDAAIARGADLVRRWAAAGCNAIGFGEMGIGNTAAASLLTHRLCDAPLDAVTGRGAGLDDAGLERKRALLREASARVGSRKLDARAALREFGGFEIAMMTGAFLAAAQARLLVLVDGFIATSALLAARALAPQVLDYCVFSHRSAEPGHRLQLDHLRAQPLLDLDLRLGEGTGAALAFPVLRAALALMNDMAGFDDAGVSRAA